MISTEVQRTLVKSPPELWAELSDPVALARHLGELGEIRILRTEPESTVEWAAENTTGTVSIGPAGWGTKVTLTATRNPDGSPSLPGPPAAQPRRSPAAEPAPTAVEPGPAAVQPAPAVVEPAPAAVEPAPAAVEPASSAVGRAAFVVDSEMAAATAESPLEVDGGGAVDPPLERRRGFLARLFGRFTRALDAEPIDTTESEGPTPAPAETADAFAAVREALAPETFAAAYLFAMEPAEAPATATPTTVSAPGPQADAVADRHPAAQTDEIAAEPLAADEAEVEQVTAVLTALLDRLGAAHHRPFSRA